MSNKTQNEKTKKPAKAMEQQAMTTVSKESKSAIRKIYVTTDGYFTNRADIKKRRLIAVLAQRKDDGAVAVVKIFSEDGKEQKIGKTFIPGLTLSPTEHSALAKNSVVGREVLIGVKYPDKKQKPKPLYASDFEKTEDKLTQEEYEKILQEVHNDEPKHRQTFLKKIRNWIKHFQK